jgi:hypothetical protein
VLVCVTRGRSMKGRTGLAAMRMRRRGRAGVVTAHGEGVAWQARQGGAAWLGKGQRHGL